MGVGRLRDEFNDVVWPISVSYAKTHSVSTFCKTSSAVRPLDRSKMSPVWHSRRNELRSTFLRFLSTAGSFLWRSTFVRISCSVTRPVPMPGVCLCASSLCKRYTCLKVSTDTISSNTVTSQPVLPPQRNQGRTSIGCCVSGCDADDMYLSRWAFRVFCPQPADRLTVPG